MHKYHELKPGKALQNIVDCYWVSGSSDRETQYIRPDGCTDLIFNFGKAVSADVEQAGLRPESISAVGMMTECRKVEVSSQTQLVGIRFKTGTISTLTSLPLHKIQDKTVDAKELSPCLNQATWEKIVRIKSQNQLVSKLDNLVFELNRRSENEIDPVAAASAACIREYTGDVTIKDIARNFHISRRQLERRFRSANGVSMKSYARIVRYLHAKAVIREYPNKSLLNIALDNGYYDHAHLTREFKKMAGVNPSKMR